jgi:hypothetical protein
VGDDSVPCARLATGTHLYAAAFGCPVERQEGSNPCALPLARNAREADGIREPDLWKSPTLYRVFELGHAVQDALGKEVFLGPPDVQSGFDTAALIWNKQDFLCSMADSEGGAAVKRLTAKCAALLGRFLREFRREFPNCSPCHCPDVWAPPEMGPWLSNDECGAFSADMFAEFCLPELLDLAKEFGGIGMHCCADAEHQFKAFGEIPSLYAFNRVAARMGYQPLLQLMAGPSGPVHVLAWLPEKETRRLIEGAPAHVRFIFVLANASNVEAAEWLERMRRLCPRTD